MGLINYKQNLPDFINKKRTSSYIIKFRTFPSLRDAFSMFDNINQCPAFPQRFNKMSVNKSRTNKLACSLQLLKVSFYLMREEFTSALSQISQDLARTNVLIRQRMHINTASKEHKVEDFPFIDSSQKQNIPIAGNLWSTKDIKVKNYTQVVEQNVKYQNQLLKLQNQIKNIKDYIEKLERNKKSEEMFSYQKQEFQSLFESPKIREQAKNSFEMMTIHEVSELQESMHSSKQASELKNSKQDERSASFFEFQSFECSKDQKISKLSCLLEIANQIQGMEENKSDETFYESLQVLKSFCNNNEPKHIQLSGVEFLRAPQLYLIAMPRKNYLLFEEQYAYIGNTIEEKHCVHLDGFGQLYKGNCLVYSGEWKHSTFQGWGKLYLPRACGIKLFNGKWLKGQPYGPAEVIFWSGDKFVGTFEQGVAIGFGSYFQKDQMHEWRTTC